MPARAVAVFLLLTVVIRTGHTSADDTAALLDAYAHRRFDLVDTALTRATDVVSVANELRAVTSEWVRADPSAERDRTFVAAAVAVELAGRNVAERDAQRILIRWGAELLARQRPDERERAWLLTANALVQRTYDPFFLPQYGQSDSKWNFPGHALSRFPEEDRFHLARVIDLELASWRLVHMQQHMASVRSGGSGASAGSGTLRELARAFEKLLPRQSIAADVHLRLGQTYLRLGRFDDALKQLNQVETRTNDPFLIYLARYCTGVARRGSGDLPGAAQAFRAALDVVPDAQSAALALASLTLAGDNPAEAYALVRSSVVHAMDVSDPWRRYQEAEYRLWHSYVSVLRRQVR